MLKVVRADVTSGTITQIDTGTGLTGGPITSSGTISMITTSATLGNATISLGNTTSTVGNLTLAGANISATSTANATFATSSLLLVPEGYITILINGTNKKIPYYAV